MTLDTGATTTRRARGAEPAAGGGPGSSPGSTSELSAAMERKMKLTIFAATGRIGRQVLEQAVAAGHDVTAVVRNPKKLSSQDLRVVAADLAAPDPAALDSAVKGADAVLSGLGARSASETGIAWKGTRAIVQAMKATGIRRIVVVSGAPIGTVPSPGRPNPPKHDPGDGFFMRNLFSPLIKAALRKHFADLAQMEDVLRDSGLDWTVLRPPRLTDGPVTGTYRIAYGQNLRRGFLVSRADVAHLMLRALERPETVNQTIGIAD
jgi:putative NADH-flavin reductase